MQGFMFVRLLKECGKKKNLSEGMRLHDVILERALLEKSPYIGNTLISMYAKCGVLPKARAVFDMLSVRDVISWNSLIAGYVQNGHGHEALKCFEMMQREGPYPDDVTLTCALNACSRTRSIDKGERIHDEIVDRGLLEKHLVLGNALVDMYSKCGVLVKAQQVLDQLPHRDVVSWNTLIQGYVQHGQGHEALFCFSRMQREGLSPNEVTIIGILKACGITGDLEKGKQIHDNVIDKDSVKENILIGTALVDMYAKCGALSKAQKVLEELRSRDVVSWNALIAGYAQQEQGHEALICFERMLRDGHAPDDVTFTCILNACGDTGMIGKGREIHEQIANKGLLEENILLGNALVDMYAKCGFLVKAQQVIEELRGRNVTSWNALITGYTRYERGHEALNCFSWIQKESLSPNLITFTCILKACSSLRAIDKGKQIHAIIAARRLLDDNIMLGGALVDMYAKCGALAMALQLVQELPIRNEVSWNAVIAGYAQHDKVHEALSCLAQMQRDSIPDEVTFTCILKACSSTGSLDKGKEMHSVIFNRGFLEKSIVLGNSLVDMYAKCGMLAKAQQVLTILPVRDIVSWNALIAGYVEDDQANEALKCIAQMQKEGISPDGVTFTCILKACAKKGAIDKGKQIHDEIANRGLLEGNTILGNALVDMYAKCGMLAKAQRLFEELPGRNLVSWNVLITAYALEGHCHKVMNCFEQMQREGLSPNEVTFQCVLNACGHSGRLEEAQFYYENMGQKYGVVPKLEHHTCMVVVFGCAGHFEKAMSVMMTISCSEDPSVWLTLLGACRKWGNAKLGRLAFDRVIQLDNKLAAPYVLMANLYATLGMQEEAQYIETMRVKSGSM